MPKFNLNPRPAQYLDDGTIAIPLTQGQWSIILQDHAEFAEVRWNARKKSSGFYAARLETGVDGTKESVYLHRLVMEQLLGRPLFKGEMVDHINRDTLFNVPSNLRLATKADNGRNRGKQENNTSGYKGVIWDKSRGKWQARIKVAGVMIHLGRFATPELAYAAYCEAAKLYFGEFAYFE